MTASTSLVMAREHTAPIFPARHIVFVTGVSLLSERGSAAPRACFIVVAARLGAGARVVAAGFLAGTLSGPDAAFKVGMAGG